VSAARVGARAAVFALALALAAREAQAQDPAPVEARVRLDRETVYLHEQVVMSIEIVHPSDARATWEPPPFDGFWAERLGTRALPDDPSGLHRTEFRRALFPTRAGELEIAPSKLTYVGDGGAQREMPVRGLRIRVRPLPEGIPPDVLVGRLELHVAGGDDRVRLGKSLPVTIDFAGDANVWDAAAPALEKHLGGDVEVFGEAPRLSIGENAGRATTRRTFRYALVPARAGRVHMAPLEMDYFDPATGHLETARSEALAFDVFEGGADEARSPFKKRAPLATREPFDLWPLLLGAALLFAGSLWLLRRSQRTQLAHAARAGAPSPRIAFDAASAARGTSEFHSLLARAVRAGVGARHRFDALPLTPAEIAARGAEREAVDLLESLERARFARRSADEDALLERTRLYLKL